MYATDYIFVGIKKSCCNSFLKVVKQLTCMEVRMSRCMCAYVCMCSELESPVYGAPMRCVVVCVDDLNSAS